MSDGYRLPPFARQLARRTVRKNEGSVDRIYYDSHKPPVPTMAVGISLTGPDGKEPWGDLDQRLREQGADPDAIVPEGHYYHGMKVGDAIRRSFREGGNHENIEAAVSGKPFVNPPPFGVTISAPQADAGLMTALDRAGGAIRDQFGRDKSGAYYFDQLQPDEQAALVDAYHNAPGLVGKGVTEAVRNGDYMKAFWEIKENVKDPRNPRRLDDARPFLANHSPIENLFNSDSYTKDVLDKAGDEVRRAMAPVPPGPTSDNGADDPGVAVAAATPTEDALPVNLLNSNQLPANLFNTPPEEMRRFGLA